MKQNIKIPNQNLLEGIFLQTSNVIAITNANLDDLKFEYVNPAFLEMTGYEINEVIGKSPRILQGPKTKWEEVQKLKNACLKGESFRGNTINYKKDGTTYNVGWSVSPIKDKNGTIINFLSIQRDITQIKKLEEELLHNQKIVTLESISSGLTHEINTLLTSCKANLEMMGYDIDDIENIQLKENLLDSFKNVNKNLETIRYITQSLHYITHPKIDKFEKLNVINIVLDSLNFYKSKIINTTKVTINDVDIFEEKNISKEFYCKGEYKALKHLFMIIIDNALDELVKNNNISLNLLDINISNNKSNIIINFTDNGGGIDKSKQKDIFKPLYKDKELGGLGLGLFIAKNIADQLNGTIEVVSKDNCSTFRITLLSN